MGGGRWVWVVCMGEACVCGVYGREGKYKLVTCDRTHAGHICRRWGIPSATHAGVSHDKCKRTHVTHISHIGPIIRDAGGACSSDSDQDLDCVFCHNDYLDLMKGRLQKCF